MSDADAPAENHGFPSILKPYAADPDAPSRRLLRIFVIAAVAAFCLIYGSAFALMAPAGLTMFLAPLGVLALLSIWALPDIRNPPTRTMEWLFFAFMILLIVWPNYLAIALGSIGQEPVQAPAPEAAVISANAAPSSSSGIPWITVSRLTVAPLALVFFICLAVSSEFRGQLRTAMRAVEPLWIALMGFVLIQTVTIVMSSSLSFSIDRYIQAQTTWTMIFFVACYLFSLPGRVEKWAAILWAAAIFVGLIALWEWRLGHLPWMGHIPALLQIPDPSVALNLMPKMRAYGSQELRVQSTFGTSLGLGEYMALTLPFVLQFALGRYATWVRTAAFASVPFLVFIVYISGARSGLIGVMLSIALYGLYWGATQWARRRGSPIGPAVVLSYPFMFLALIASTFVIGRLRGKIWGGGAQHASTQGRLTQYTMGIPKVISNPFGHGIGQGGQTLGFLQPNGSLTIDTYYLLIALEYGVIGFIIFYGMFAYAIYEAALYAPKDNGRDPEASFLGPAGIALASFLVIKSVFSQQDNHPLAFMLLGMISALIYRIKRANQAAPAEDMRQVESQAGGPRRSRTPAHQPATP